MLQKKMSGSMHVHLRNPMHKRSPNGFMDEWWAVVVLVLVLVVDDDVVDK